MTLRRVRRGSADPKTSPQEGRHQKSGEALFLPDPLLFLPDIPDISDILPGNLLILKDPDDVGFSLFQKSYPTFPTLTVAIGVPMQR